MTPRFHIMSQIRIQVSSLRRNELFTATRQVAPLNYAPRGRSLLSPRLPYCSCSFVLCSKCDVVRLDRLTRAYNNEDVTVTLSDSIDVDDVLWLSVWCIQFTVSTVRYSVDASYLQCGVVGRCRSTEDDVL